MQGPNEQRKSFPLRLSRTMREEAIELAHREGISMNQFISHAIAEKITRLECSRLSRETQANSDPR